jgi:hypothetical protein
MRQLDCVDTTAQRAQGSMRALLACLDAADAALSQCATVLSAHEATLSELTRPNARIGETAALRTSANDARLARVLADVGRADAATLTAAALLKDAMVTSHTHTTDCERAKTMVVSRNFERTRALEREKALAAATRRRSAEEAHSQACEQARPSNAAPIRRGYYPVKPMKVVRV